MIGSLLYLIPSRPDISFSIGVCAWFQGNPKESHLIAITNQANYLFCECTMNHGIWYSRDTNLNQAGYSNADWASSVDDRKSTSGGCFYVRTSLVAWMSKKHNSISFHCLS
jgi:hypothetical protein